MPRVDYDTIKKQVAEFVSTWRSHDTGILDQLFYEDVSSIISVAPGSNYGWDRLEGVRKFVETYPRTDYLQMSIYNFACRLWGEEAHQSAIVICESEKCVEGQEALDVLYYSVQIVTHWIKKDGVWKASELRLDVNPYTRTSDAIYDYFCKTWHFGNQKAYPIEGQRTPAVVGELDSPWIRMPQAEDVLTEIEQIKDCANQMYFGADYLIQDQRLAMRSRHLFTNSERYGLDEGRRKVVSDMRYKRQKVRYWCHPFRYIDATFNEDHTRCRINFNRVFGWEQRNHEYVWTKENVNTEHHCMVGVYEFIREDGIWKLSMAQAKLGLHETGPYSESLYGDVI